MMPPNRNFQRAPLLWALGLILLAITLSFLNFIRDKPFIPGNQSKRESRLFFDRGTTRNHSEANATAKTRKSNRNSTLPDYSQRPKGMTACAVLAKMRMNPELRPPYYAFDDNGRVTGQLEAALSLTDKERNRVQDAFKQLNIEMQKLMADNMLELSDLEKDGTMQAYRIRPYEADGENAFGAFLDNIQDIIGKSRSWQLAKALPVEGLAGQLGANELIIKVASQRDLAAEGEDSPNGILSHLTYVNLETRNPKTGEMISTTNAPMRTANRRLFGFFKTQNNQSPQRNSTE